MRQHLNVSYDVLVLSRPDISFENAKGKVLSFAVSQVRPWFRAVGDELYLMTFKEGLARALTLTTARCCDIKKRSPRGCFYKVSPKPRANYISVRHFDPLHTAAYSGKNPYRIVRTADEIREMAHRNIWALNGVTKNDVLTAENPAVSPPFYNWSILNVTQREDIIRTYLPSLSPGA